MIQECNLHWKYKEDEIVLPWFTLPALQWLTRQVINEWEVFEYGSGYSTIWFRLYAKNISSVDHNEMWAKAMGGINILEKNQYIESVSMGDLFDCIVVDGEWREECVEFCLPYLKPGGYLIIDNYDSENFDPKKTEHLLKDWEVTIHKQPNHTSWQTAIFTKP